MWAEFDHGKQRKWRQQLNRHSTIWNHKIIALRENYRKLGFNQYCRKGWHLLNGKSPLLTASEEVPTVYCQGSVWTLHAQVKKSFCRQRPYVVLAYSTSSDNSLFIQGLNLKVWWLHFPQVSMVFESESSTPTLHAFAEVPGRGAGIPKFASSCDDAARSETIGIASYTGLITLIDSSNLPEIAIDRDLGVEELEFVEKNDVLRRICI